MERNVTIAQDRLNGATYRELASQHDVSKTTIYRVLNDPEIKDVIDTGTREIISRVPLAIARYDAILNNPEHSDHYKSIKDCLTTTGIFPSHTSNVTINNILNVTSGPSVEQIDRIQELLEARQAIDIECIEEGE
jgi:predicted transcriptional regulator